MALDQLPAVGVLLQAVCGHQGEEDVFPGLTVFLQFG